VLLSKMGYKKIFSFFQSLKKMSIQRGGGHPPDNMRREA
jgi:hypothetical protein